MFAPVKARSRIWLQHYCESEEWKESVGRESGGGRDEEEESFGGKDEGGGGRTDKVGGKAEGAEGK